MNRLRNTLALSALTLAALATTACGPDYPNCDNDENCHEGEFCVNGTCQDCRTNSDCATGQQCTSGACEEIPGYCDAQTPCPAGQECVSNRCQAVREVECDEARPCPTGSECVGGDCSPISGYCDATTACPGDQLCENNRCRAMCTLGSVYFEFDSSSLSEESRATLQSGYTCATGDRAGRGVTATGHADPRGTEEYNLVLSESRARAVQRYLHSLGFRGNLTIVGRGEEMSSGSDEASWARDRRVDFE